MPPLVSRCAVNVTVKAYKLRATVTVGTKKKDMATVTNVRNVTVEDMFLSNLQPCMIGFSNKD